MRSGARTRHRRCAIVGLGAAGAEPAWAVPVDGPCTHLATGADGEAIVACDPPAGGVIHRLDASGDARPGWPVDLGSELATVRWFDRSFSCGPERAPMAVATDGTMFVATVVDGVAELAGIRPDGTPATGWPQPFPGDRPAPDGSGGDGCRGFTLADPSGRVVQWGYEGEQIDTGFLADRTEYTIRDLDGSTVDGWPRGSTGAATAPAVRDDGGIAYTSATDKIWAHGPDGEVRAGWPFEAPSDVDPTTIGAPIGRSDGYLVVPFLEHTDDTHGNTLQGLFLLDPDGRLVGGRPVWLSTLLETRCLFGDTPCAADVDPVFGPDGMLYVSLGAPPTIEPEPGDDPGGEILAIDPTSGAVIDGWPVALGADVHGLDIGFDASGNVVVQTLTCPMSSECYGSADPPIVPIVIPQPGS